MVRQRETASAATSSQPPIPISITICGDGGCGKSSITLRLVRSAWTSEYDPTIEDSYSVTRRVDGVVYHLALTDTAGQEEYRGMWASSNLSSDAFLMVYDITSRDSLDALGHFNDLIDMEAENRLDNAARAARAGVSPHESSISSPGGGAGSGAKTVPPVKIVAGNKCDLQESRQVPAAQGLEWARRNGCGFMETSVFLKGATTAALPLWQTDELWLDGAKDVLPEGSEELKALEDKKKEKPNVGRKRKALEAAEAAAAAEDATDAEEDGDVVVAEVKKPAKKKAKVPVAESNDDNLDKQIKERKEKLKKQKKKAKLAMED
ncbi:Ras protein let-60 [Magnaporthiopsis poae ATCC 64411]|uniref:Ras protein let-60 n=1 Tax=Magnaporthiopsis poae (strain ATCC 64411 / 73-15) TaxID=644358 RepID=A0A0C4EAC7_MAGP6|nr:Ras protein let-60 [Magnaporthiopsis poae ATCC 64411]